MATTPLPDRPDLAQLRRRAKELKRAADAHEPAARARLGLTTGFAGRRPTLALAQLAIAREHGFGSWARLVAEVERRTQSVAERTTAFVAAVATNRANRAARLLRETPAIAAFDVFGAAAAGDAGTVSRFISRDRALVTARDRRQGLTPLLYAAGTRLGDAHAVTALLLDHGADANERGGELTALYAAVRAGAPTVVGLLLGRGADPDDGDSLYHATELGDHACLRLLLAHGASEAGSNALAHMLDADDPDGTRLLLDHGADATDPDLLRHAVWRDCGAEVIGLLIEHGADPSAPGAVPRWTNVASGGSPAGISTLRLAVRKGRQDVAALLREHGAADDVTPADELIGACMRDDRDAALTVIARNPDLLEHLTRADHSAMCDAAHYGRDAGVALMLDLGFPLDTTGDYGGTPLHLAAIRGRADLVRSLLDRGADPDGRDRCHNATPLQWALVGHPRWGHPAGRWQEVVETLLAHGATVDGAWLPDDGPIADLLGAAGVSDG